MYMGKRDQSAKERRKKKKRKKTNKLTAASRAPCRKAQRAWIQEKGGPPSERGSQYTCDGKGAVSGEGQEKREKDEPGRRQMRRAAPHTRIRIKRGPPLAFASEREPVHL